MDIIKPVNNENLKIALFMGATIDGEFLNEKKEFDHALLDMGKDRFQNQRFWASNTLKYHKDWSWLMPVVDKCEKVGAYIIIKKYYCTLNDKIFIDPVNKDRLLNVYYAVSNFINEYNEK